MIGKADSRSSILIEIFVVIAIAVVLKLALNPVTWRFSGPISIVLILPTLTWWLWKRGTGWHDLGLQPLVGARAKLMLLPKVLLVGGAFAVAVGLPMLVGHLAGLEFLSKTPSGVENRWGDVEGNVGRYLLWLFITWTTAAFGEEMLFRGYLVTRLQTAFRSWKGANVVSVLISAALFGLAHVYYQGLRGLVVTGMIGIAFGAMFLLFRRNLWPIIIWHGLIDTLTFTATFKNWDI